MRSSVANRGADSRAYIPRGDGLPAGIHDDMGNPAQEAKVPVARISASADSIRVRVGSALLTISGDARELLDTSAVESEICGLDKEDTICVLLGMGFEQRGTARKGRDEMRRSTRSRS